MGKYKIFVDTGADIPQEIAEKYDIGVIRFLSVFGEETIVTGTDITNEEFYKKLESFDGIPTTAQTPYGEMLEILKNASDENDVVIYYSISSKGSGQYNSACMIKNEILEENPDADIRIIDTMKFSVYTMFAAIRTKELLDGGESVDSAIEKALDYMNSFEAYVLVDTLKYLEKGGRITKTSAIVGSLLDIKPVLTIKDGLIEAVEKIRGRKKLYKKLIELVREFPGFDEDNTEFVVVHSNKEYCEETKQLLSEEFEIDEEIASYELGPVIGTHIGPGTLAILFRVDK